MGSDFSTGESEDFVSNVYGRIILTSIQSLLSPISQVFFHNQNLATAISHGRIQQGGFSERPAMSLYVGIMADESDCFSPECHCALFIVYSHSLF